MCNREPRRWFARHGLSWSDFATTGIPASKILATNDALCLPVVEVARMEAEAKRFDDNLEAQLDRFEEAIDELR